ncbi:hypothetical protein HZY62_14400 [Maribacter polysiphoniae]|uniref:Uncharacterized protein n=1 Tax=Maribacter polysiphoniae TaxID=429344 RepID=A0A316DIJ3_9FLAO|nr:hypothetical protein [Maribacter polysiphoniae]MBD1261793.1 hypothetical protein [Maribacter polysiphoniae]PWK17049.1 hypothetical protein LX92_04469 [Maribacter polysiphoniae]
MKNELEILNNKLLGQFISRFSLGDTWELFIGEYCLSAHTIQFEDEGKITEFLEENYDGFIHAVDKEDIAKSTIMAANLRKTIVEILLDNNKNITIDFENGSTMNILTNSDIVDWQWCINKSGKDPYRDNEIACFWAGEIKIKE